MTAATPGTPERGNAEGACPNGDGPVTVAMT